MMRRRFSLRLKPEWVFLIAAVLSGSGLCFLIPVESGFDEITHLARIWEMSGGYLIPNQRLSQGPYLPHAFAEISYRTPYFYNPVSPNFLATYGNKRIDWNVFDNHITRSVYFPTLYLAQAIAVGILGRVFSAPVLVIIYTCRFLYLLGYILLCFFAIRLIPFGKWLLGVLALAPMTMFQASTISPDSYTNGACFLFIAWMLNLALQNKTINWKQLWITIGILAVLFSVKVNAIFLLPLLLFLFWKGFEAKKMIFILVGAIVVLFAGEVIGWNILAYSKYYVNVPSFGVSGQLLYIISHPLIFGTTFIHDISANGIKYLREWVAVYGYDSGSVPPATYIIFGLALVAAWLLSSAEKPIGTRIRVTLILTGISGCLFTIVLLYLTFTDIGSSSIDGVQGRYFIPMIPALILGFAHERNFLSQKVARIVLVGVEACAGLVLAIYMLGIYFSFYVICGTSLYTPGLCYQPLYRNWDPNAQFTHPVTQNVAIQQTFTAVCTPLRSVRVWSARSPLEPAGSTLFTLTNAENGTVLFQKNVNNKNAADHSWQEVTFPAIDNTVGKQFTIGITSKTTKPAGGLLFGITSRREYLIGAVINSVPADYDLIFQYGCEPPQVLGK